MIPASVERSIVEILDEDNQTLGTGAIVSSDGLVLTAAHVRNGRTQVQVRHGDAVDIATHVESGPAADWSLLRLPAGIATVPIPMGDLTRVARDVTWYAIGHANLRFNQRGAFHGVVRREQPIDLYCEELDGKLHADAQGLSGAPCLVDGEAVALIVSVLRRNDNGAIVTGQVNAIPLRDIRPQIAFTLGAGPPLPWEDMFTGAVQALTPAEQGAAARIARLGAPLAATAGQIARRMINGGVLVTAEVVAGMRARFGAERADELRQLAENLWVRDLAAESLATLRTQNPVAIGVLATDKDWAARHHFERAFACKQAGAPTWKSIVVSDVAFEPFVVSAIEAVYAQLATLSPRFSTRDKARAELRRVKVTAFVRTAPRADVIAALRSELPELGLVFLTRAQLAAGGPADLVHVAPPATEDDELRAEDALETAAANF